MKGTMLPWQLLLIVLSLLLVRERDATWIQKANEIYRDSVLRLIGLGNETSWVTFVSYDDAALRVTESTEISNLDAAIFLRATLQYEPVVVGFVSPLEPDDDFHFLSRMLTETPNVFVGQRLASEPAYGSRGPTTLDHRGGSFANAPDFLGALPPLIDPETVETGFTNVPESVTSVRRAPLIGRLQGRLVGSVLLAGLRAGDLILPAAFTESARQIVFRSKRLLPVSEAGTVAIAEGATERVNVIPYDEFVLECEKAEQTGDTAGIERLVRGRVVLLGQNDEASHRLRIGNENWSDAYFWAVAFSGVLSGTAPTRLPLWWEIFGPVLALVCMQLSTRMRIGKALLLFLTAGLLLLGTTLLLLAGTSTFAPPLPALLILLLAAGLRLGAWLMQGRRASQNLFPEPRRN